MWRHLSCKFFILPSTSICCIFQQSQTIENGMPYWSCLWCQINWRGNKWWGVGASDESHGINCRSMLSYGGLSPCYAGSSWEVVVSFIFPCECEEERWMGDRCNPITDSSLTADWVKYMQLLLGRNSLRKSSDCDMEFLLSCCLYFMWLLVSHWDVALGCGNADWVW